MIEEKIAKPLRILHLEDNRADVDLVKFALRKGKLDVEISVVDNRKAFINSLNNFNPDIILVALGAPKQEIISTILSQKIENKLI